MKKQLKMSKPTLLVLFTFFILLVAQISNAQDDTSIAVNERENSLTLGWKIGINHSFFKNYKKTVTEKVTKFQGGLFADYVPSERWSFEIGLNYEERGRSYDEFKQDLRYLGLSICPTYHLKSLFFFSGYYYNYLVKASDNIPDNLIIAGALKTEKFNKDDIGLKFGIGINFLKNFSIQLCYSYGLASVYDVPYKTPSGHELEETYWYRTRAYSVTVRTYLKKLRL